MPWLVQMRRKNHMIRNGDGEESFGSSELLDELLEAYKFQC